jgi:hypothetical protein
MGTWAGSRSTAPDGKLAIPDLCRLVGQRLHLLPRSAGGW